jgi:hypothetical protein
LKGINDPDQLKGIKSQYSSYKWSIRRTKGAVEKTLSALSDTEKESLEYYVVELERKLNELISDKDKFGQEF